MVENTRLIKHCKTDGDVLHKNKNQEKTPSYLQHMKKIQKHRLCDKKVNKVLEKKFNGLGQ